VSLHAAQKARGEPGPDSRARRAIGLFGLCLGTALIVMEANVVNVAIPDIRARMHADAAAGLWMVDGYTLVLAVLLLSAGRLGDRIGARRSYLAGLAIFGAASVLCSLAGQAALLIPARALQGAGAALLAPAPLTLITRMYADPAARAQAVTAWVSVGGIGFTIGPLLSGLLLDTLGWRSIFLLNVPVVLLTGWLVHRYVAEAPGRPASFDPAGQLLAVLGLTGVVYGLVSSSLDSWSSASVLAPLAGGLIVLAAFVAVQRAGGRQGREVLLPPGILAARPVLAGLLSGAVYNFTLYGMLLVYTFAFQDMRHYSAMRTGVAFLPLTLTAIAASSLIGGRFTARRGPRSALGAGMTLSAAGLAVLAAGAEPAPYPVIAAGFIVFSLGMGLTAPAQTLAVMTFAPDEHKNMASSALNSARQTGGVIGVALLGAISAANPAAGLAIAMLAAAAACLTTALTALRHIPANGTQPNKTTSTATANQVRRQLTEHQEIPGIKHAISDPPEIRP
jgi:DHA2 family methylenomycin A resistance protein-like MFS transporter